MAILTFLPNEKPVPSTKLKRLTTAYCDTIADRDGIIVGERWNGRLVFVAADETYYQWSDLEGGWVTLIGLSKPVANAAARPAARIGSKVFRIDLGYEEISLDGTAWVPAEMHVVVTDVSVVTNPRIGMTAIETTKLFRRMLWDGSNWVCSRTETVICANLAGRPVGAERTVGLEIFQLDTKASFRWDGTAWLTLVGAWVTYTPVVTATSFTIGNGAITGRYREVNGTVTWEVRIDAGTTTNWGPSGSSGFAIDTPPGYQMPSDLGRAILHARVQYGAANTYERPAYVSPNGIGQVVITDATSNTFPRASIGVPPASGNAYVTMCCIYETV